MTAIVTSKFRIRNAEKFKKAFNLSVTDENYYLFVGKPRPWPVDTIPPVPQDELYEEFRAWESMMGLKKIIESNAAFVLPRFDWDATGDTIYVPFSDTDENLFYHPTPAEVAAANLAGNYTPGSFYVLTDEYHVFKCLSNGGGEKSTIKPLKPGNSLDIVETADGYRWKYMYTIGTADALKYLTDAWMPVKTLLADDGTFQWLVQQGAVDSVLTDIQVTAPGSLYDKVRATAEALQAASPTVITLHADAQTYATGNGFYNGCTLWFETGPQAGQSRIITAYNHSTNEATLDSALIGLLPSAGDQYKILPTVTISGNGTGARGKAFVDTGAPDGIVSVAVVAGGTGYRYATATISGAGGSGAVLSVVMPPIGGHGKDAVLELGARFCMLNVRLEYNEGAGDFPISNDYRQIGIARNVLDFGTTTLSTASTRIAAQRFEITPLSGTFQPDENVVGPIGLGSPAGFIVEYDGTNEIITFIQDQFSGFSSFAGIVGQVVTGSISGASGTVTAVLDPEVERYSGDIIYIENRRPIMRASDQLEDIKLIVEF